MRWPLRILSCGGVAWIGISILQACMFNTQTQPPNVLFLGNSITLHDSLPSIGWSQENGMAATVPDSDYVHSTIRDLQPLGVAAGIFYGRRDCEVCDGPIDEHFHNVTWDLTQAHPRWVVVQLGENSNDLEVETGQLLFQYRELLWALRQGGDFPIFCLSVWNDTTLTALRTAAVLQAMQGIDDVHLVDITALAKDSANYAYNSGYADPAIQWHPGNHGHAAIASILADSIAAVLR